MLDPVDADHVQKLFGSTEAQVRRDHAISHVLVKIMGMRSGFVFYGGTALSRTYLNNGRLSEDSRKRLTSSPKTDQRFAWNWTTCRN